jgi:uncharacterized membrane protein YciS (DUF1049 family)
MSMRGQMGFIPVVIGVVVVILILLSLAPTIGTQSQAVTLNANMTTAGQQLSTLFPMLYIVLGIAVLVGTVVAAFGGRR